MTRFHTRPSAVGSGWFWCPGCDSPHMVSIAPHAHPWGYNGDAERPTLTPSVLVTYNGPDAGQDRGDGRHAPPALCHSFVTDGRIQFLSDCSHDLANQTVDLPEYPEDWK
jgi:hypothetical protein